MVQQAQTLNSYALRHLATHLCKVGRYEEAAAWATRADVFEARVQLLGSAAEAVADLRFVQQACRDAGETGLAEQVARRLEELQRLDEAPVLDPLSLSFVQQACRDAGETGLADAQTGQLEITLKGHTASVSSVAFSPDGTRLASGSDDDTVRLWDARGGQQTLALLGQTAPVTGVCFSPDGTQLARSSLDQTVRVWDREVTGWDAPVAQLAFTLQGHRGGITAVAIAPDGQHLASLDEDDKVKIWDRNTQKELHAFSGLGFTSLAFSPASERLAAGESAEVRVWNVTGGQRRYSLPAEALVSSLAFAPEGKRLGLVTGMRPFGDVGVQVWSVDPQRRQLWSLATTDAERPRPGRQAAVGCVAFSRGGRILVTAGGGRTARLWEAETGREAAPPLEHAAAVRVVAFSPDGKTLLTGTSAGEALLWDVATGKPLGPPLRQGGAILCAGWDAEGVTATTGSEDRTIRCWQVAAPLGGSVERIVLWAQILAGKELALDGTPRTLGAETLRERRRRLAELGGPPTSLPPFGEF